MAYVRFAALCVLFCVAHPVDVQSEEVASKADEWLQWRGPNRAAISAATGLKKEWESQSPERLWTAEGLGEGYAGISIGAGRIFTMGDIGDDQAVLALDVRDGSPLWKTRVGGKSTHKYPGARCTPTIDGSLVYAVASNGDIACLQALDGQIVWQQNFQEKWNGKMMSGWGYAESPLVDGDRVLCTPGGNDAMVVALDKLTGDEIWRCAVPELGNNGKDGAGYSSIVVSHGAGVKQYVQLTGRGVIGVRADDGKFLWGYNDIANKTANIPTSIVSGDHVFCSTGYQTGAALLKLERAGDGVKAEEVYFLEAKTLQNHHGGMVLLGEHLYCGHGHNNGFPICVELKSGDVVWGGDARGPGKGSAAVTYADGHLIYRYQSGEVALIEATPGGYNLKGTFKPEYIKTPSWAHPVVLGGRLYLREWDKLMCYDVRAAS